MNEVKTNDKVEISATQITDQELFSLIKNFLQISKKKASNPKEK